MDSDGRAALLHRQYRKTAIFSPQVPGAVPAAGANGRRGWWWVRWVLFALNTAVRDPTGSGHLATVSIAATADCAARSSQVDQSLRPRLTAECAETERPSG
jgi:hypothetical protein